MEILESVIYQLSPREVKEFKLQLGGSESKRKDLILFGLLLRDASMSSDRMRKKLYGTDVGNSNAYHSLRKQLVLELQDFLVKQRWIGANRSENKQQTYQAMADFAMERGLPLVARYYFLKSEKHLQQTLQFAELDTLYHHLIEHAEILELEGAEVMNRWRANTQRFEAEQRLNTAYRIIRFELTVSSLDDAIQHFA